MLIGVINDEEEDEAYGAGDPALNASRKNFNVPREVIEETPLQKLIKRAAVRNPVNTNSMIERPEQPSLQVEVPRTYSIVK